MRDRIGVLKLHPATIDYVIMGIYFVVVLGIGFVARLFIKTDLDFFLSGRSLPAWITGLAFIAANLGALEILGQAANGAQYGVAAVHYYWIGAVPAMVFLGLVMMPFYYGAKVRSVPEYLRLRFNEAAHAFNAATFAIATVLISGVNLFALALIIHLLLGWSVTTAILVAAALVLVYITLGGLTSAIYNEVLQFFVIVASLLPLTIVALHSIGGIHGISRRSRRSSRSASRAFTPGRDWASITSPTRSRPTGSGSSSGSASCSASATGRRTSPRSSGRCRRATCRRRDARR